jgi:hypothetical protein
MTVGTTADRAHIGTYVLAVRAAQNAGYVLGLGVDAAVVMCGNGMTHFGVRGLLGSAGKTIIDDTTKADLEGVYNDAIQKATT